MSGIVWDGTGVPPTSGSAVEAQAHGSASAADAGFDPADHTVAEVQAYLADNPDQADHVLELERAGKNRTTLIGD